MADHIFLSYKREEYSFALSLATKLKLAGINVWMDRFEIKTSDNFSEELRIALNNCIGLIAILSPDYFKSRYCPNELKRAYNLPRPIFPVIYRKIELADLPIELESNNYIDFSDIEDPNEAPDRLNRLIADIQEKANDSVGASPDITEKYLIALIKDLENRKGVLEYVELEGAWIDNEERPHPHLEDGWLSEYSSLVSDIDEGPRLVRTGIGTAAAHNPVFMLLGEPGTGKTTTLCRLASDAAKQRLENALAPIPLVAYLSQWDVNYPTPQAFLEDHWPLNSPTLVDGVADGSIALYVDGLNEMGSGGSQRAQQLHEWVLGLEKTRPKRCIITCRTADYVGDLYFGKDMPEVTCQPLTRNRIREFAKNYLTEEGQADKFLEVIIPKGDADSRHLFTLAQNPYLLTAFLFVFSQKGEIARNTGELFKGMVDILWKREEKRRTMGWQPYPTMLKALSRLAFIMIDENRSTELATWWAWLMMTPLTTAMNVMLPGLGVAGALTDAVWLVKLLKPLRKQEIELFNVARAATLIDVRGSVEHKQKFRFYHQLMQEYFAAEAALNKGIVTLIQPPAFSQLRRVAQKWDQVIIAASGITKDKDSFVLEIAATDPVLAAECIGSGIKVSKTTSTKLFHQLIQQAGSQQDELSYPARDAIAKLGLTKVDGWSVEQWLRETISPSQSVPITEDTYETWDVLIAYRRNASAQIALYVQRLLHAANIRIWMDVESLRPSVDFASKIEHAVVNSKIILLLIGNETFQSEWVIQEIRWAFQNNKVIVPVLQEGVDFPTTDDLPPDLHRLLEYETFKISDRSARNLDSSVEQLISFIKQQIAT